ncbi:MAG TPA: hypothetical protein VMQ99_21640 [Acetobacteraceae bacterium]|jgi:hypothetical protein|nr:hypothetical protein [Acetobacteraceae bacterium]
MVTPGTANGSPQTSQQLRARFPAGRPVTSIVPNPTSAASSAAAARIPVALHNLPQHETARISRVHVREAAASPAGWCPDRRRCRLAEWATDGGVCLAARCSIVGPDAALGLPLDATAAPSTGSRT